MNSEKLSARSKQPGHDTSFRQSEENFVQALRDILPEEEWKIVDHPSELMKIIDGRYGIKPEASIEYLPTGRKVYFEVKKQGPRGNAEERACKHHTVRFYEVMHEITGFDYHPFVTVMCEDLATHSRYTHKHPAYFKDDQYFCWVDYNLLELKTFVEGLRDKWLIDGEDKID